MNKKIFATALFAIAAFVSTGASAAITYGNNVGGVNIQNENSQVNPGGTSRANDLTIVSGGTDVPADSEVIIRLPAGINFSGTPTYLVDPKTANAGLTLKDNTAFGDPTLGADAGVDLFDTNADGGMDRAVVTVSSAALTGDTLTISINVTANSDATVGDKKASIIVNGGLAQSIDLVEVTAGALSGIVSGSAAELVTVDQAAYSPLLVSTPSFGVVIPAGAENGDTITLNVAGKVQWDAGTSTISVTGVFTPVSTFPLTSTVLAGGFGPGTAVAGATSTVTLTVQGAPTGGFTNDVVVELALNYAGITAGSAVGDYGLTAAGTAGVTGTANLFSVKENGSSAALITGATLSSIVTGSSSQQTLPTFVITENYDQDAFTATTPTITLTAGAGLKFGSDTSTVTVTDGGSSTAVVALTSSNTVMTINLGTNKSGTKTVTISGVKATVSANGNVSMTVTGGLPTSPNSTFAVATGVPVGTVSVAGPTTLTKLGDKGAGTTAVTLTESTYGSISRANYSDTTTSTTTSSGSATQEAYFRVTPANAKITSVSLTTTLTYAAAGDPTFNAAGANGVCKVEAVGAAAWICTVFTESTSLTKPGTDTVTVDIAYTADGAVGDTVSFALDGNAAVEGSVDAATIVIATTAKSVGALPILSEGSTSAQAAGTLNISENSTNAIGTGYFRLIAPAGVVFAAPYPNPDVVLGTATIAVDTFAPNDTLVIWTPGTPSITITPNVIVADSVMGYISFDIVDGDIDANSKTSITAESVDLAYADKSLTALDAGAAVAVNIGYSKSNDVDGGLAPYTVASSSDATATVVVGDGEVTVTGVAAGAATITLTDALGGTDTFVATVSAPAAIPAAVKAAKGATRTGASFLTGATADGGNTFADTFTTADDVTIVGTVNVDAVDQGLDGAIHVAIKSDNADGVTLSYLDEDSVFMTWDPAGLPGAHIVAEPLAASYNVTIYSGTFAAGTYRIALAYTNENGDIVYTGKAIVVTVTE